MWWDKKNRKELFCVERVRKHSIGTPVSEGSIGRRTNEEEDSWWWKQCYPRAWSREECDTWASLSGRPNMEFLRRRTSVRVCEGTPSHVLLGREDILWMSVAPNYGLGSHVELKRAIGEGTSFHLFLLPDGRQDVSICSMLLRPYILSRQSAPSIHESKSPLPPLGCFRQGFCQSNEASN